ncbi:response regulator transcription factor [Paenibacillus sp. HJGM_3]|uniref:response regulator transcription factor n=1 Tax=Paenibacillus sp. HJGM_3 TaxID=3379816 RepID=UPI00385D0FF0
MKVLIIDDDCIFGDMLSLYLAEEDFNVHRASTGKEGLLAAQSLRPDTILLDTTLPDIDGIQLCAALRDQSFVPIIMISSNTKIRVRIQALNMGADDYLCKPFCMQELKARIQALARRVSAATAATLQLAAAQELQAGYALQETLVREREPSKRFRLDLERRSIYIHNLQVETTFSEFELMKLFYQNPGKVFSRDELINAIRGLDSYVNERSIDVHVTNLRKKIEVDPRKPLYIRTVWGIGYKFTGD